ncbi:alpha-L-rhamnosidase [Abditibacterium utsteinense]|uniref:alpha-L-rhamnosidase n=1 Tax=Abditibacterium utsteinense TaxID=1960156 RepID=A0A2S8SUD1_9BACT|nr:alpha-L-rhamnosidase [Abditibacterium utsteinense]PQV64400.1 alpha-L-rhamnosidase [Abditibacterium utsteinense]
MKITDLRCEYFCNPLGLGTAKPRLFWKLESGRQGARQVAYRVVVASSPQKMEAPDLWDSNRVASNQTTHLEYNGRALESRHKAFWRVEIEDESGATFQSEIAHFEIGLLTKNDWSAAWIGGNLVGAPHHGVPSPYLRCEFSLEKPVKAARLYASALGLYKCQINGQRVGNEEFSPGWTNYDKRVQYQSFDVTSLLQSGENAIGATLGDGWYCGRIGWKGRQNYGASPQFLGQLEIEFQDGEKRVLCSDTSWKFAYGPIVSSDWMMGESYDARLEFPGWSAPGFNDKKWMSVEIFEPSNLELSAPLGPPVRATEEVAAVSVQTNGVVDFGQNLVGRVRLKVSGPRGETVRLRFAETLKDGPNATLGPIYTDNLRSAAQTDYYTLKGEGEEIYEPHFTFHGFRFVEVSGFPGELTKDALTAVVLHSDTPKTGDFSCSDALINQLQRNIDWGQRGNFLDIPTDCPQRDERLGWTGDAQVFVRTAAFNRDVASFFAEWARDFADAQVPSGGIPCVVPDRGFLLDSAAAHGGASNDGGPAWADAAIICPWTIYRCYGDTRILEENYRVFERYLNYLENTAQNFVRCEEGANYYRGFGDWLALDGSGQTIGGTPFDLLGTAFFAYDAHLMSQIAGALGKTADAARYFALFDQVRQAFTARFVSDAGIIESGTQTAYLLALHFDLLPENLRQNAADALAKDIENRGNKLTTGFAGSPYLNHVLTRFGHIETAYALLHQSDWPSWLYAVTQGATTIWERWNGWTHDQGFENIGMNSFNHYAYGAIGAWLYQTVAGIELDEKSAGYARFVLAPKPGGKLTSARAHLETLHGRIESAWQIKNGQFEWNFQIPANTSARVTMPNGETFEAQSGAHFRFCKL